MNTNNSRLANLNADMVKTAIVEYKQVCATPTYRGFLLFLGLGSMDYVELVGLAMSGGDGDAMEVLRVLDMFKLEMEVMMEELMLYQQKHPAMEGVKYYNFGHLKDLLKWSNPSHYGDKQAALRSYKSLELGEKGEQQLVELSNNSDIKWLK